MNISQPCCVVWPPQNNETTPGVLLESLVRFPAPYTFQVVGKPASCQAHDKQQFVEYVTDCVSRVCQHRVAEDQCVVKERLGGKYISVSVETTLRAPELVQMVYQELGKDERVKMRF